ncbi:hypothetical protein BJ508DRAFT_329531 [Ascobolus immersus RN42]|uniref:Uncharacterized protein n=1 Tax=Ascobolus immersus RN42 TaxID=1160509 RepID=A0A3N4I1Q0_ASCIM|nr:hypothetical protein BJ508DRAFT_329531 [Ascobolus immersus RN42]
MIKNVFGTKPKIQRFPLTRDILLHLFNLLWPPILVGRPISATEYTFQLTIAASFALAFSAFLHVSRSRAYTTEDLRDPEFNRKKATRSYVRFSTLGDAVQIFLPRSKTDPSARSLNLVLACTDDRLCPVKTHHCYLTVVPPLHGLPDYLTPLFYRPLSRTGNSTSFTKKAVQQTLTTLLIARGGGSTRLHHPQLP